jgi:hypothetical protein
MDVFRLHSYCDFSFPKSGQNRICIDPFCTLCPDSKSASWIHGLAKNLPYSKISFAEVIHFPWSVKSLPGRDLDSKLDMYFQTFTPVSSIEFLQADNHTQLRRYENWTPQGKEWTLKFDNYRLRPTGFISILDFVRLYSGNKARLFNWSWRTGFHFTLFSREQFIVASKIGAELEKLLDECTNAAEVDLNTLGILRKGILAGYGSAMESQLEVGS